MENRDLKYLAELMDTKFKGPFGFRFGLDGLIGLIPVVGDIVTNSISLYIILRASFLELPPVIILRMCLNLLIESLVGMFPVIGNIFDFGWKANTKNVELIKSYQAQPKAIKYKSSLLIFLIVFTTLSSIVFLSIIGVLLIANLSQWILALF